MQSISIRNLGPIKEFDYEIKDLTLLIGAQGSGKSTIAKAVFFFRTLYDEVQKEMNGLAQEPRVGFSWEELDRHLLRKWNGFFDQEYTRELEFIRFHFQEGITIGLIQHAGGVFFEYSPALREGIGQILSDFEGDISEAKASDSDAGAAGIGARIKAAMGKRNGQIDILLSVKRKQMFIPAGRARYSAFEDRLDYLTGERKNPIVDRFIDEIEGVRAFLYGKNEFTSMMYSDTANGIAFGLAKSILGGELRKVNEVDRFFFAEQRSLPIDAISSGQQEALWLVSLLLAISIAKMQNFYVVIEEPEAHLHPEAQFLLCKLIALAMKQDQSQIFITTHSPYILAAFNNMLLGAKVGKKKPEAAAAILPQDFWIDHNQVFAGEVEFGRVVDISSDELELIKVEELDAVSSEINKEFDELFELD